MAAARRRGALGLALAVAATVLVVDQVTKAWAAATLDTRTIHVVWTLRLALTHNSGIAFGQAKGRGGLSGLLAVVGPQDGLLLGNYWVRARPPIRRGAELFLAWLLEKNATEGSAA